MKNEKYDKLFKIYLPFTISIFAFILSFFSLLITWNYNQSLLDLESLNYSADLLYSECSIDVRDIIDALPNIHSFDNFNHFDKLEAIANAIGCKLKSGISGDSRIINTKHFEEFRKSFLKVYEKARDTEYQKLSFKERLKSFFSDSILYFYLIQDVGEKSAIRLEVIDKLGNKVVENGHTEGPKNIYILKQFRYDNSDITCIIDTIKYYDRIMQKEKTAVFVKNKPGHICID